MRVVVIGLDGATWDLIKPWADSGELPTFKWLMENGSWGHLQSTIPSVTCPAWISMLTGKNPGKLGIYYFRQPDWEQLMMKSVKINWNKYLPLWKILNSEGYYTNIINTPTVTPTPDDYKGAYVQCPLMGSDSLDEFAYPDFVRKLLKDMNYERLVPGNPHTLGWDKYLEKVYEVVEKKVKLALNLFENTKWHLFFFTIFYTDQIMHYFWHYMDKNHPKHVPSKYEDTILEFFKFVDYIIEEFLNKLNKNDILILVSDHGHGPMYKEINYNMYFNKIGLLKFKPSVVKEHKTRRVIYTVLGKLYHTPLGKIVDRISLLSAKKSKISNEAEKLKSRFDFIDWQNTIAYNPTTNVIFINVKGREKYGVVPKEDYHKVREIVIKKLQELKDPETGKPVIKKIWVKEEIYSGKYFDNMPNILVEPIGETFYINYGFDNLWKFKLFSEPTPLTYSTHTRRGIFLAYGPGIKKGHKIENAKIYDIAPTILHIFGLPIPNDMDGKVLMDIFEEDSEFAKRKPKFVDPDYYEKNEKRQLKERIKKLKMKNKI